MSITVADIKRWQPEAIQDVARQLTLRAANVGELYDGLDTLPMFATWKGRSGEAAKDSIRETVGYLSEHVEAHQAAATAMRNAASDIWLVKRLVTAAEEDAAGRFAIDEQTGEVTPLTAEAAQDTEALGGIQAKLRQAVALGDTIDAELVHAVNLLDGTDKTYPDEYNPVVVDHRPQEAVNYALVQKARDESTLRTAGDSPEGQAAAARLRDYETLANKYSTPEAKKSAAQRINDFLS